MKTMCNCIKDTEECLKSRAQLTDMNPPKNGVLKRVFCRDMALLLSSGKWTLTVPFMAEYDMPKGRKKEVRIGMIASHCPFCGKPFEPNKKK